MIFSENWGESSVLFKITAVVMIPFMGAYSLVDAVDLHRKTWKLYKKGVTDDTKQNDKKQEEVNYNSAV